jgi:hypothetical protein
MSVFWALGVTEENLEQRYTQKAIEQYSSEEYRALGGIPLGLQPPDIFVRITHAYRLVVNGIEYFFVGNCFGKEQSELLNWGNTHGIISNREGSWKIDAIPEWTKYFQLSSEENMKAILQAGKARISDLNYLVPAE